MLIRMTMAGVAIALATQVQAQDCVEGEGTTGCAGAAAAERAADDALPSTLEWSADGFVLENLDLLGTEQGFETPAGEDVLYWDGESAMIVPETTGPRLKVADW